jgi:hypothetical protein
MNKRLLIGGALTFLILLLCYFWFQSSSPPMEGMSKTSNGALASNPQSTPSDSAANTPEPTKVPWETGKQKEELVKEIWDAENARSLDFYGKVIDQYGQPVVEATVIGNVMIGQGFNSSRDEAHTTQTDTEGSFKFTGLHGMRLGVVPSKPGYEYNLRSESNWTENYKADSNQPVIFTLWKLKGAEPMVHTKIEAGLACNGTPRHFDVVTGRRDAGKLVATLTRNPLDITPGNPFDWTLTLDIEDGGLIKIIDSYPNEAPADGYQTITINMPANTKNWTPSVVQSYYFYDGRNYGRVTINIMANYQPPPTHIEFEAYMNPSGSRNLEYDKFKEVKVR